MQLMGSEVVLIKIAKINLITQELAFSYHSSLTEVESITASSYRRVINMYDTVMCLQPPAPVESQL